MDFSPILDEKILESRPISGGDIGRSYMVRTLAKTFFVKYYSKPGVSVNEAHALSVMSDTDSVSVPDVIKYDENFLVLSYILQAPRGRDFQSRLGKDLAGMHRTFSSRFGFHEDNYIGSTPQKNSYKDSWIDFYLENRLDYQVKLSGDNELSRVYARFRGLVPELLKDSQEEPCLIHGDLWAGNVISGPDGRPVLIDPAAYFGHREMELAMTQLFGGFSGEFYSSYNDTYPLKKGWRERQDLYKLYHVLNHLNLFGSGYRAQALGLMNGYLHA